MIYDLAMGDIATDLGSDRGSAIVIRAGASDPKEGTTLFVASTDNEDRALDIVKQDWRLAEFRANPVILDNHNTMRVVGRGIESKVPKAGEEGDVGKLMIRIQWDQSNPDPSIRAVGHQHMNGFRSAGSVGFRSGKKTSRDKLKPDHAAYREPVEVETWYGSTTKYAGTYYEQNTLMEFSSATIPMNPDALQRAMGSEPERQLADRLSEVAFDDLVRRLEIVKQTVPRSVAEDLGTPEALAAVVDLLIPGIKSAFRSDPEFARIIRGLVDAHPVRRKTFAGLVNTYVEKGP